MSATDKPFDQCVRQGVALMKLGHEIVQKFTCSACGARNTMSEKNKFFTLGNCEACGYQTDIKDRGCGYMLIMNLNTGSGRSPPEELDACFKAAVRASGH